MDTHNRTYSNITEMSLRSLHKPAKHDNKMVFFLFFFLQCVVPILKIRKLKNFPHIYICLSCVTQYKVVVVVGHQMQNLNRSRRFLHTFRPNKNNLIFFWDKNVVIWVSQSKTTFSIFTFPSNSQFFTHDIPKLRWNDFSF